MHWCRWCTLWLRDFFGDRLYWLPFDCVGFGEGFFECDCEGLLGERLLGVGARLALLTL